jgi:polyhydroxyalkanoate synthesis regulator phasin
MILDAQKAYRAIRAQQSADLRVPAGYVSNDRPRYFVDEPTNTVWQPDVYQLALALAKRAGCAYIIDIGSGNGSKLAPLLEAGLNVVSVDVGANLEIIRQSMSSFDNLHYIPCDLNLSAPSIPHDVLNSAVLVASDVIEHLISPSRLLTWLSSVSKLTPFVLISTPDRDRVHGYGHLGPPVNPAHVREWNLSELMHLCSDYSIPLGLSGFTRTNDHSIVRNTCVVIGGSYLRHEDSAIHRPAIKALLTFAKEEIPSLHTHCTHWLSIVDDVFIDWRASDPSLLDHSGELTRLGVKRIEAADLPATKAWIIRANGSDRIGLPFSDKRSVRDVITTAQLLGFNGISAREVLSCGEMYLPTEKVTPSLFKHDYSDEAEKTYPVFIEHRRAVNRLPLNSQVLSCLDAANNLVEIQLGCAATGSPTAEQMLDQIVERESLADSAELRGMAGQIDELRQYCTDLEGVVSAKTALAENLMAQVGSLSEAISQLNAQRGELTQYSNDLERLSHDRGRLIADLELEVQAQHNLLSAQTSANQVLRHKADDLTTSIDLLSAKVAALSNENAELNSGAKQLNASIEHLNSDVEVAAANAKQHLERIEMLEQKNSSLQIQNETLSRQQSLLVEQLNAANDELSDVRSLYTQLLERIRSKKFLIKQLLGLDR